jgi:hypothetical protein
MQFFKRFCDGLKLEMIEAIVGLIEELDVRFPIHSQYQMPWELFILNIGGKHMQTLFFFDIWRF